jgi:endonuclease YncB( thermonuclease family)
MKELFLACVLAVFVNAASAEENYTAKPRGSTSVRKSEYATGHGALHRKPRNYDAYYYSNYNGYALSPYLLTTPQNMQRGVAAARPYSNVEYGRIVEKFLSAQEVAPAGMSAGNVPSIVQDDGDKLFGAHCYRPVTIKVLDVLDRGVLMVASHEEVRLRGVRIYSERSTDDVNRTYARAAIQRLRDLTQTDELSLILDSPLRDSDGAIMAVARLKDGTDLNKLLLREGLGQLRAEDFADDVNYDALEKAEQEARANKRGIWSKKFSSGAL